MGRRGKEGYEIPLAPIDRILHQESGQRVSDEAVRRLRDFLEKLARQLARDSAEFAQHAGRRTIIAEDVDMAIKRLYRELGFLLGV